MTSLRDDALVLTDQYGDDVIFERLADSQGHRGGIASVELRTQDASDVVLTADDLHRLLTWTLSALGIRMIGCGPDGISKTFGQPYTDAELARGQDDTRDQTLTLALLADRVNLIDRSTTQRFEEVWHRLDTVTKALDLAEGA